MAVLRDNGWNRREYGQDKWPPLLAKARSLIDDGERSLSRVVRSVHREMTVPISAKVEPCTVLGKVVDLPRSFAWSGSVGYFADLVIEACGESTQAVVELGSGWGRCLFDVWLRGGPRRARYYGLEMTESGRACAQAIAAIEPDLAFYTTPYDFTAPDYAAIERSSRAVVFSDFSICVVPRIPREVFTGLRALADEVVGLTIEPFGWQLDAELAQGRAGSSAAYAERHDYTRNVWPLLRELREEGVLEVDFLEPEAVGLKPECSMSVARWRLL